MATRQRGAGKSSKRSSAPPPASAANEDSQTPRQNQPHAHQAAEVTGATLERREIPSFSDSREARIAEAAYWRAERRGFAPGAELDDWLAAEREIDQNEGRNA
ncbi:MAG TPA: DUF2934 domain-containing protein [Steroidobacter sp.]|nr:DUF2934 domain-containing protein [Steroidobacter sp.]